MKVFDVYINNNDGFLLVCAEREEDVLPLLYEDEDSPLFERDLEGQTVDIYENKALKTDLTEPTCISWMIDEYVDF